MGKVYFGRGAFTTGLNYSALPNGAQSGEVAYVKESEGTQWLPSTLGGAYYPAGWYVWDGTVWVSDRNAIADALEASYQHILSSSNPHNVTATQVGLSNVDNTSDLNKPISNATQAALDEKQGLTWDYYVMHWDTEPTLNATITNGEVYNYTLDGVTRYRFVPTTYTSSGDAFYTTFDGSNLTGLIISRSDG